MVLVGSDVHQSVGHQTVLPTPGLADQPRSQNATTTGPHIHDRWGLARSLELSYCINRIPGDDQEFVEARQRVFEQLAQTTAEWERHSGVNFVHIEEDDNLEGQFLDSPLRAECAPGAAAYFGVIPGKLFPGLVYGGTNIKPQRWNDPTLEPSGGGVLQRYVSVSSSLTLSFSAHLFNATLRHELGHVMGFDHEENNLDQPMGAAPDCTLSNPTPLVPVDSQSIVTTAGCSGLSDDADLLTQGDRLSAFILHHRPRSRFETGQGAAGYRFSGMAGGGAEILWHSPGAIEGVLWRPDLVPGGIEFTAEPYPYFDPVAQQPGWYPNENEVVIPMRVDADTSAVDLVFFGPGPDANDYVSTNTSGPTPPVLLDWNTNAFSVPVVGAFDSNNLLREIVYLYQPGPGADAAIEIFDGAVQTIPSPPQMDAYAYPIAAPFRGPSFPDDVIWWDPLQGTITGWRFGEGVLGEVAEFTIEDGLLGLVPGEYVPAVGDFNGDHRADIMWQGVSNLPDHEDIQDVLWLSTSTPDTLEFDLVDHQVGNSYRPFVGDFDGNGIDDIFWHRSWRLTSEGPSETQTGDSFIWYFNAVGGFIAEAFALTGDYSPYVGDFDADGCHDIAWFDSPADTLSVWRCVPGLRNFDCGEPIATPPDAGPVGQHWGF